MTAFRVPVVIRGYAIVRYGQGRGIGDYVGGLPRDAEFEALNSAPYLCGARMLEAMVELAGEAEPLVEPPPSPRRVVPIRQG
jgi:hypothetical protein